MGSFSNTVFSILLGWLQILVSMIWSALTAKDGHSFLQLIGDHWILIAAILCMIGLAADFAVYLFRWQPYKVWRTFWTRIRKERKEKQGIENAAAGQEEESFHFGAGPISGSRSVNTEAEDLEKWQDPEAEQEEEASSFITRNGYSVPEDSPYRRPANRRRNRLRIDQLLGEDSEDGFHYSPPQPMIDQHEAYQPPVYPEKWTGSRNQDS